MTLRELMQRHVIHTPKIGKGGTLVDTDGRVICTMNLDEDSGLTISEAFLYAELFTQACANPEAVVRAAEESKS
jgi:hypothetical protein